MADTSDDQTQIGDQAFDSIFLTAVSSLIPAKAANRLIEDGIIYLGDLVQYTEDDLLRIPYFKYQALDKTKQALAEIGLHLGMEVPGWPAFGDPLRKDLDKAHERPEEFQYEPPKAAMRIKHEIERMARLIKRWPTVSSARRGLADQLDKEIHMLIKTAGVEITDQLPESIERPLKEFVIAVVKAAKPRKPDPG
jgi:hypothetical protein